jgi:hypothetical protein
MDIGILLYKIRQAVDSGHVSDDDFSYIESTPIYTAAQPTSAINVIRHRQPIIEAYRRIIDSLNAANKGQYTEIIDEINEYINNVLSKTGFNNNENSNNSNATQPWIGGKRTRRRRRSSRKSRRRRSYRK